MNRQLAVIRKGDRLVSAVLDGGALDDVIVDEGEGQVRVGDIYVCRVSHIVNNIRAAFVEIKKGVMCYLPLTESEVKKKEVVQGQEFAVQVKKAAVKSKQAVVTRKLEFAGRYAVVTAGDKRKCLSSKIDDDVAREHLSQLLSEYGEEPFGIILRTSSREADDSVIRDECSRLLSAARSVQDTVAFRTGYCQLHRALPEYVTYLFHDAPGTFDRLITDEGEVYDTLCRCVPEEQIEFYEDAEYPLDLLLGISSKLEKAFHRHVWLKSGGSLVIEPTEALTVIDVNTERAIAGKRKSEMTFFKINMEAAAEAARQIRIRNISGIIIIDFIDMKEANHVDALLKQLEQEFCKDNVKTVVVGMTRLGLVEITRMKVRKPIWELNLRL